MLPAAGAVFDGINATWYLAEGDYTNAALSGMALIPVIGEFVGAGKAGLKGVKCADDIADAVKALDNTKDVAKAVDDMAGAARCLDDVIKSNINSVQNALPNVEKATINPNKLTGYALNPEHPVGGNKAKVFESALGYNQSNASGLMKQIYEKLPQNEAILGKLDQYGQRYTVDIPITGPNGNTVNVRTGWIIKTGSDVPELTTIFVK